MVFYSELAKPLLFPSFFRFFINPMAHTKTTANPPPPRTNYKALYPWAPDEVLAECSSLTIMKAWKDHIEGLRVYQHRAIARRHDEDIAVLPCVPSEPICGDERANNGVPFFYIYQTVFKRIGMRLPFSAFERELFTKINVAPAQLHPNSWASVKAFDILCGYLGQPLSVDIFLHFFEVKKQGKSLWVSLSSIVGRVISPFSSNHTKAGKGNSSRCAAPIMTVRPWTAFPYTGWRRSS